TGPLVTDGAMYLVAASGTTVIDATAVLEVDEVAWFIRCRRLVIYGETTPIFPAQAGPFGSVRSGDVVRAGIGTPVDAAAVLEVIIAPTISWAFVSGRETAPIFP